VSRVGLLFTDRDICFIDASAAWLLDRLASTTRSSELERRWLLVSGFNMRNARRDLVRNARCGR